MRREALRHTSERLEISMELATLERFAYVCTERAIVEQRSSTVRRSSTAAQRL
ncbi:MAG: hypothetical protein HY231_02415 [Acidobacteria bacterium]|nr:hypothetical protein [Acidobacteriota bacterium]